MCSRVFLFSSLFIWGLAGSVSAQAFLESQPVGTSRDGVLIVYGSSGMNNNRIPYERISGNPFWKPGFQMATLSDAANNLYGRMPVKLNLYTNEVLFKTPGGEERVAAEGKVRKILFHPDDTSKTVSAIFENELASIRTSNPNAQGTAYVQVLNQGDYQLLKHIKKMFVTADSLFGTMKRYYFSEQIHYYLNDRFGQAYKLKKLSKEAVTEKMNLDKEEEEWIRSSGLSMRKEEEVLQFLNYLNEKRRAKS
jgi:hypothetical protein